ISNPAPLVTLNGIAQGSDWRAIVIGVGGSGVTTISRVIAEAAQSMSGRDDLNFKFVDQKGLAQRNGSVTSHLALFPKARSHGQVVPMATANVVVSPDLLEGARAVQYLSETGYLVVDEDFQVPLSIMLDSGREAPVMTAESLRTELREQLGERLIMGPFKRLSFERFQRPVYASAMLLGVLFQKGLLPFSLEDMEKSFKGALPGGEFRPNWEAFNWGRQWFLEGMSGRPADDLDSLPLLTESVRKVGYPWQNSQRFVNLFNHHRHSAEKLIPTIPETHWAQYFHDLFVFDQGINAAQFLEDVRLISESPLSDEEKAIAVRVLAKTYWIKDEVFVSHLMVSPLKLRRDRERYPKLGTSFSVKHINRPAFVVLGKKIEFDFSPKPWMLQLMRHVRLLRTLMPAWHAEEKR
ncbi:MAG: 2-oxoacid:acceptor oxidoreductase family protein, partial [Bacteriovoracia bacterium]